jgi:glycosyltransferase involved in cell wall biosynthesis
MKLSIIIPIYKVEKYISKCLDSIVSQKFHLNEYEIICINDGSPDNSKEIVLEYQNRYSNIQFIDQENQGVSVARNKGLDVAKGEYILFIDPDDSIYENSLKSIINCAKKNNLDILYLSLELFDEDDNYINLYEKCGSENNILDGIAHPRRTFPATLYKKSAIGTIRFIKGVTRGQDTVFNAMVQSLAKRCSYCSIPYYKYLQRETSSRQFVGNDNAFNGCLIAITEFERFKKEHFLKSNIEIENYFKKVELIFLQRLIEWNILPELDKNRFQKAKLFLKQHHLKSLEEEISLQFKFFNKSYFQFYTYQIVSRKYYALLTFLSKMKRKIIK